MSRGANAVDFWRGFALVTIFVNHIPGVWYEVLTHRNISLSDSAELFVFLAGWSLRYVAEGRRGPLPTDQLMFRLGGRAITLYAAHMLIVMTAIAMLALAARAMDNPLLLEWHNAAPVFFNPVETHIGLVLLSHQLGYFDILPLYVVLMLFAPVIVLTHRAAPSALLPLALAVYFLALVLRINFQTWPSEGQWFFNPLCWQLVFVLGFVLSGDRGLGGWVGANLKVIRWLALPVVVAGALMAWFRWWPDPTRVPEPKLLLIVGKTFVTPLRLIQFLALIAVFSAVYPLIGRHAPRAVAALSSLGRNSLPVFCSGSVLSLAAQILRFYFQGGIVVDTVLVASGITLMWLTGWLVEWRARVKVPA